VGISKGLAKLLLDESNSTPFSGKLLLLGKSDIYFTNKDLYKIARQFNTKLKEEKIKYSLKKQFSVKNYISDDYFFKCLGFSEVSSLDYSDFESADIIFDLNNENIPKKLENSFDMIIDAGTTEHVFNIPNVLKNLYKMLQVGGRIIHCSPSSNHIDHGFYMFSPTLFWDYYSANKFHINNCFVIKSCMLHDISPWRISIYEPGCLDRVSFGGLDNSRYSIFISVTKSVNSTYNIIPQQGAYRKAWGLEARPNKSMADSIKNFIKSSPFLFRCATSPISRLLIYYFTRRGLKLKVVKKY